jgi:chemotaxis protein MotD
MQHERPQPIHPLEIAESLAKADLTATALQKAAAQAESAAKAKTPSQAEDTGSTASQKGSDAVAANVKASLSALEAMLMQENSQEFDGSTGDDSRSALIEKALKDARISSVRQETHYGFGLSQSPVLQIAQRITHEIQIRRGQSIGQPDPQTGVSKPPVRILQIQLDPPQLGPLTIRMSLQNELLNLQLETPKHETAHLLQNDKDSLSKLLRSAGYAVDGLNIQVSPADRGSNSQSSNLGGGFGQAAGQQPGWRQPERQASENGWRSANQGNVAAPAQKEVSGLQPGRPRGGAVYL